MQNNTSPTDSSSGLSRSHRAALALIVALSATHFATAATLTWDGSNAANAQPDGGAGTWDSNITANWWNGSSDVVWPATGLTNEAVFANTAGIVTLDAAGVTANKLTFNLGGYTLSGAGTLTLNGASPSLYVASGQSETVGANTALVLAGSSGFAKTGTGTLTLSSSAASSITGGVSVLGGTLALSLANVAVPTDYFPASNSLSLQRATLALTGKNGSFNSGQTFNGTSVLSGISTLSVNNASGTSTTLTLGTVSQAERGGVVSLVSANPSVGQPNATSQVIKASNPAGYIGAYAFVNDPRVNGRWANVNASGQVLAITGTAGGTNMASVTSPTTVYTITGNNTLTANRVAFAVQDNDTSSGTVNLGSFSLTTEGLSQVRADATTGTTRNFTGSGSIVIGAGRELVAHGKNHLTISVPVVDNPAGASHLTYAGGATFSLDTAASTYTGLTTVNSGTFRIGLGGEINTSSAIKVNGGTFLQANNSIPVTPVVTVQGGAVAGTGTINTVQVASGTIGNASTSALTIGDLSFTGAGSFSLKPSGSPTVVVTNSLVTTIPDGKVTLNLTPAADWGASTTYNLLSYGSWAGSLSDFTVGALPSLGARKIVTLGSTGPTNGSITLTVTGDSALWTGAADGNWTTSTIASPFNWRTLAGAADTQFLASDDVLFNDTATGTTNVVISDANVAPNTTTFANDALPYTVSSPGGFGISAGTLSKTGTGTVTLNNVNTYTGGTSVLGGTLALGNATDTLANTGAVSVFLNGTLDVGANTDTVGAINLLGGTITGTTGALTGTAYNFQSGTVAAGLASSGLPVVKTSSGTVTLTGAVNIANSTGDVLRVSGGASDRYSTLILSPSVPSVTGGTTNNKLSVASNFGDYCVFTQTAGTLNTNAIEIGNIGVGTLNLSGGVTNTNSVTLAFTGPFSDNGYVNMNVDGSAALNINNNGKLILGIFYGRKVTINQTGGTVTFFGDAGTTEGGTGSLAFEGGSTASSYNLTGGVLSLPAVTLRAAGAGAGGGSGTVNLGGGELKITSSSFTVPTVAGKTITFNVGGDSSIPGSGANINTAGNAVVFNAPLRHNVLSGVDGGLVKLGAGSLTLTEASTYTGPTSVSAGTLALSGVGSLGSGTTSLTSGSTLDVSASSASVLTLAAGLSGSGTINATGKSVAVSGPFAPGVLAVTGNLTLDGSTQSAFAVTGSPATSSAVTVTGSVLNSGSLAIVSSSGFSFADGQSIALFTASSITAGFASVSVDGISLTNASGVWSAVSGGLTYTYTESTGTLAVAAVVTLTPMQVWLNTYFPTEGNDGTGIGAPDADPDLDGVSNLLEYATNTNPTISSRLPVVVGISAGRLTLTFPRIDDPALTYTVQGTNDLVTGPWLTIVADAGNNPTTGFTGLIPGVTETVSETVIDPVVIAPLGKRFIRLSVSIAP